MQQIHAPHTSVNLSLVGYLSLPLYKGKIVNKKYDFMFLKILG